MSIDIEYAPMGGGDAAWEPGEGYAPEKGMAGPLVIGAIAQFVLCLGLSPGGAGGGAAGLLGYMLGAVAPAWLILHFGFGRQRDPAGWWKIPLVIVPITFLTLSVSTLASRSANEAKAMNSIAAAGERLLDSEGRDAGGISHSGATGEAGELERVFIAFFREIAERRRRHERDLELSGYPDALSQAHLRSRSDVSEARRRITAGRALIERYHADHARLARSLPDRLDAAQISDRSREEALRGFQDKLNESNGYLERVQQLDLMHTDVALGVLELLAQGSWRRQGEEFLFFRQADADAFNAFYRRMTEIEQEQAQLIAEQERRSRAEIRNRPTR